MNEWQIASLLHALHNIATGIGSVAFALGALAVLSIFRK